MAFLILPYGCEKDDSLLNEEQIIEPNIKIENVTLSKSKHHNKLSHLLKANENNSFNRNSNENEDFHQNFTIDTSSIKYIEGPVSHSYTFALINKTQDSEEINNLVIAKHNDMEHYIALHFKYELSSIELLNIENGIYPQEFQNEPVIEEIQNFDFSITSGHHRAGCVTYNTIYYDVPCSHPEHQAAHEFNPCGHPEGQQTITVTVISDCPNSPNLGDGTNTDTSSGSGSSSGGGGGINWGGSNTDTTQNNDPGVLGDGPLTQINVPFRSKIRTDLIDNLDVEDLRFLDAYPHIEMALNTHLVNNLNVNDFIIWSINYLQNLYLVGTLLNHPFELNLFNSIVNSNLNNQEIINLLAFHELAEEAIQNGGEVDFEDQVILDETFLGTKAECVFNLLRETDNSLFKGVLNAFLNGQAQFKLKLQIGSVQTAADGVTSFDGENGVITITFPPAINTKPSLEIATIILHEGIHAELRRVYHGGNQPPNQLPISQYNYLITLYEYYQQISPANLVANNASHTFMVHNHVLPIANAIRELDNSNYDLNHYMGFGWEGLSAIGKITHPPLVTQAQLNHFNDLQQIVLNDNINRPCDE